VHPIERLRHVARAGAAEHRVLVEEAAPALAAMSGDGAGLVMSCRRLVERTPASGPLWNLCARVLCAADARAEAWAAVEELDADLTSRHLARALPADARVTVLGWPEVAADALRVRGDVEVLVVDTRGEGSALARQLARADVTAEEVDEACTGAAVLASDVVVLEAEVLGPGVAVGAAGSRAAACVAASAGVPVWLVAGAGRALPAPVWEVVAAGLAAASDGRPWEVDHDLVPLDLVAILVGPAGAAPPGESRRRADGPVAPELLAPPGRSGPPR
jgi:translation initiation factor 2B subunit (eIF-2B alpha/beta/delta family)